MRGLSRLGAWLAVGICAACLTWLGAALAAPHQPDQIRYKTGPFIITCTSTGQVCNPPRKLNVKVKDGKVQIKRLRYRAAATHCSPGRILVSLDGQRVGQTDFVNAGERATVDTLKVTLDPGRHRFAFRIEGKVGGCNVGSVGSWGGKIFLTGVQR